MAEAEARERYWPTRALPAYAYTPGLTPHPLRDPAGHSFADNAKPPSCPPPERWREDQSWLYGVDLYNHGYFWEAHETWETCWHSVAASPPHRDLIQGLIQLAAACLRRRMEPKRGGLSVGRRALVKLERARSELGAGVLGVDVDSLISRARTYLEGDGDFPFIHLAP